MKQNLILLFLLCSFSAAQAQSIGPGITFNTAGGSQVVGGNTYEWSLGEMAVVSTNTVGNITITHGVLQPFKKNADAVENSSLVLNHATVYPNPADQHVILKTNFNEAVAMNARLYDAGGRIITDKRIQAQSGLHTENFDLSALSAGTYFIILDVTIQNSLQSASFKIQKQ
ncbi:MAG: T9SS type A sorting domain-containing protein [Chitinophagaceae bacterium]|nr:T9SS type A sorting domain-containing protein [Chitinophagaceae bacterium]